MSSLMVVVSISLIVPTTMSAFPPAGDASRDRGHSDILRVSHCIAIVLFIMLLVFVLFHFRTHRALFQSNPTARDDGLTEDDSVADEGDVFTLNTWAASCVLITATLAMIACVTFVVKSVDDVARRTGISAAFLVVVLVPLVGNATKSATMVAVARKGEIDQAVRSIIGSNLRILILLTPVLVLMGWILDQPLTLQLDTFDATMFFLAIMVMNYLIRDGRSNYFEGLVLVGT
jgi:Ca2+:H+ antiporter